MKNLKVNILSDGEIKKIHQVSLKILSEIGILASHDEARQIFKKAGCEVDEEKNLVKIPAEIAENAIHNSPASFTIHSRDGEHDVSMVSDGSHTNYLNLGIGTKIARYINGKFKNSSSTLEDTGKLLKVIDACDNIDWATQPVSAMDLAEKDCVRTLYEVYEAVKSTSKPFLTDPDWKYVKEYFEIIKACYEGDEDKARERPFLVLGSCTSSPLQLDFPLCELAIRSTEYGMPMMIMGMAMGGASSPIHIAGTLAQHNAEILAGITLVQLSKPGHKTLYGSCTTMFDFNCNTAPFGSPELALISSAGAQIAQYYGIPSVVAGVITDSKTPDSQAAFESTLNGTLVSLANASNVFGAGIIELGMACSLEQIVIANDIIDMLKYAKTGVEVTDETLSFESIKEVGIGGDFLAQPDTMKNFNKFSNPELFDRNMYDEWTGQGSKTTIEKAQEKVEYILANHNTVSLSAYACETIERLISEADIEFRNKA